MRAWVDGVLLESASGAVVPVHQGGGVGDSVFTTVLVVAGRAFAWERHVERLAASAEALGLPPVDRELLLRAAREVVGGAPGGELGRARLRLLWGRSGTGGAHLTVRLSPLAEPGPDIRVITPSLRRTPGTATAGHKTTAYADNLAAAGEARRAGADEALLLTVDGDLSEGTATNVFWVKGGVLLTPSLETGCLPGIARALVLEWFGAQETKAPAAEVMGADELFLTSSTREVQPVREWGGRSFPAPGPVTEAVMCAWREQASAQDIWVPLA